MTKKAAAEAQAAPTDDYLPSSAVSSQAIMVWGPGTASPLKMQGHHASRTISWVVLSATAERFQLKVPKKCNIKSFSTLKNIVQMQKTCPGSDLVRRLMQCRSRATRRSTRCMKVILPKWRGKGDQTAQTEVRDVSSAQAVLGSSGFV